MDVERHFNKIGEPAYVMLFKAQDGQPRTFKRLIYPNSVEFERLWGRGVDAEILPLDAPDVENILT